LKKNTDRFARFGTFFFAQTCFILFALFYINSLFVQAQGQTQIQKPHPAVVRVIVRSNLETSLGSGTLIAKKTNYGFVITNWHVVRDSNGYVTVKFPDGQTYQAAVVAVDDRWDLALLIISWPKGVEPVVISSTIPKIGETYWVAGYRGDGTYRIQGGRCINFQAPEANNIEPELIEIDVPSESGDSGGPIFNKNYELAGVLFGSTVTTMGTHCGRVFKFLEQAAPNVASLPPTPEPVIKAALLSQQSILQRGEIAFGSSTTRETRPVSMQHNTYAVSVSPSSSFGGSGSRARGNIQATPSPTLTQRKRHGFLNIEYDLSVANTLLAAERRNGTNSQINTPVSGNLSFSGSMPQGTPANASSDHTTHNIQPINRTGTQGDTLGGTVASTQTATVQTPAMSGLGNMSTYPQPTGIHVTSPVAETLPVSASQITLPQTAGVSPAYGGNVNGGNVNGGIGSGNTNTTGTFNNRPDSQVTGTASKTATGTFATPVRRETETAPGGTRSGTGNTANSTSNGFSSGATTGGRTVPSSTETGFNTYSQNSASPQSALSRPSHGYSSPSVDFASEYAIHSSDMQLDDDYAPKYADEFIGDSVGSDVTGGTSKYDAIKIVIAILVIFFILFHTIKTMAVAEDRQQLA